MRNATLPAAIIAILVSAFLSGCSSLPNAAPPVPDTPPTRTIILRANIIEVQRLKDRSTSIRLVVWHLGPDAGPLLPMARLRVNLKNVKRMYPHNPVIGSTSNYLVDQIGADSEMRFENFRFAPQGSQEKLIQSRAPYADPNREILIRQ